MPKPPPSSSGRGRPPRPGGAKGRTPPRSRTPDRGDRPSEGPPWKRREADAERLKQAGWGGVARKGAGRMRDAGRGDASKAFRAAEPEGRGAWAPEQWIDEGEVRGEANRAVGRGRAPSKRRPPAEEVEPAADPSLGRAVAARSLERAEQRLRDASRAFNRERFDEARKILRPLAEAAPSAESVRELLGLTYYRLGRWKAAAAELEAFRSLTGSTEQHPVLADCYRALGRHAKVAELWEELRSASPSAPLVAEGRIVAAGALADQGRLDDAIRLLQAAKTPAKRPKEHHLRIAYALADLHERAGDVPTARQLFRLVAAADPDLGDVAARLRALG
jgi:tetratricopeptide (TPR) repeat protein